MPDSERPDPERPSRGRPRRTALWLVVSVVLAVAAGAFSLIGRDADRDDTVAAPTDALTSPTGVSTTGATSAPTLAPSVDVADLEPHDPAGPVLDALDPASPATQPGVAAHLQPLLANPALGASVSATVLDPTTDEFLLDADADVARTPASTTKILTAFATLESLGPDTRFLTRVLRSGDEIVLVGGGDPALSQRVELDDRWIYPITRLDELASDAADALIAAGTPSVRVGYADDLFTGPAVNPAWEPGYVPTGEVAPVSALSLDGGRTRPGFAQRQPDPAKFAADRFAALLTSYGIQVQGATAPRPTPTGEPIAVVESPTVATLVAQMLARSDNDVAEMLARHVARAEGLAPTFAGGGQAIEAVLSRAGIPTRGLELADGSGLSRRNRITPATLARTLEVAYEDGDGSARPLLTGLPVAGFTGTLANRFADEESAPQAGDIRAKTGYLTGVVSLAGYLVDADGRALIFVVLADAVPGASTSSAQRTEDQLAARLATCGCD